MRKYSLLLLLVLLTGFAIIFSCSKEEFKPADFIDVEINDFAHNLSHVKAVTDKGITVISALEIGKDKKSTLIITVKGEKENNYIQEYDYLTGVSVTQCSLSYKTFSKSDNKTPEYYVSFEGFVKITSVDKLRNTISGYYNFKVKSIPDKLNVLQTIKGSFDGVHLK